MTDYFSKKNVLITGAASGIGAATAVAFAKKNTNLILIDTNDLSATTEKVKAEGIIPEIFTCDVSVASQVHITFEQLKKKFPKIDVAFNNAGIFGMTGNINECSNENWNRVISTNLNSVFYCMKEEINLMLSDGGTIINNASVAGIRGFHLSEAYTASKHGVVGLTRAAALNFCEKKIRINCICPGFTKTAMLQFDALSSKKPVPTKKIISAEDIANTVIWLAEEKNSMIHGTEIIIDGGYSCY